MKLGDHLGGFRDKVIQLLRLRQRQGLGCQHHGILMAAALAITLRQADPGIDGFRFPLDDLPEHLFA